MHRSLIAAALALATASSAAAADRPGDLYTYESQSHEQDRTPEGGSTQTNRLVFELKVLAATAQKHALRYTLKSAEVTDSQGPSVETAMRAMVDDPLDFDLAPDGALVGLPGWDAFKARLLARLDQSLGANDPMRAHTHEMFADDPADAAQRLVLGDAQTMAASEAAARLGVGKVELPPQDEPLPGGGRVTSRATIEVSQPRPGACVLVVKRTVVSDAAPKDGPAEHVEAASEAEVSTVDGHVLSLTQRHTTRASDGGAQVDLTLRRLSPPPACGG